MHNISPLTNNGTVHQNNENPKEIKKSAQQNTVAQNIENYPNETYVGVQKAMIALNKNGKYSYKPNSVQNADINFCGSIKYQGKNICDIKPSELKKMLDNRDDIKPKIKAKIDTPTKLALYDELNSALETVSADDETKDEVFYTFMSEWSDSKAALDVVPALIEKGYNPETLTQLGIKDHNKNQVEYLLNRTDLLGKTVDEKIQEKLDYVMAAFEKQCKRYGEELTEEKRLARLDEAVQYEESKRPEYEIEVLRKILTDLDDENVKYLDECFEATGDTILLPYWQDDFGAILNDFIDIDCTPSMLNMADRIKRRGHNYESVSKIADGSKLDETTERLLEFKNYDKFKDVDTENFDTLSSEEKKEFLNAFISSIDPKEILYDRRLLENFGALTSKMKIYSEIYSDKPEEMVKNYQDVIRKLIDSIPESKQKPIMQKISYGDYMSEYRKQNPHLAMTDDISKLPFDTESYQDNEYKVATITEDTDLGIATHRMPAGEAILNVQALEMTDPNEILCIGLKGGNRQFNFDPKGYALAVKPRLGNDWWLQSFTDIDSGNGASKNIYTINRKCLRGTPSNRTVTYIPELIKKELDLSDNEYHKRALALQDCTTLDEIAEIDPEMETAIRNVVSNNRCYEGIIRPEVMGICIDSKKSLSEVSPDILNYCKKRDIPLIRVVKKPSEPKQSASSNAGFKISVN